MKQLFTVLITLHSILSFAQPAGTLDASFGNGGKVITNISSSQDKAYAVAIQSDGKILVAGYASSNVTGKDFVVVRYKSNGTLDSTFANNGIAETDLQLGSDDVAYCLTLQPNGKIILGGYSDNGSNKDAALIRYNSNGIVDSTFGNNGVVLTNFENAQQDEIKVVKIHPLTGNIIVGGSTIINSTKSKPVVARYLSNGTIDTTFNSNGIRLLWITNLDNQYSFSVEDLVVQPNGKISAIGWRDFPSQQWSADYWACRINSDGSMDNTFSSDGVNTYNGSFNGNDRGFAMLLAPNNNIFIAGSAFVNNINNDFTFLEINSSGTVGSLSESVDWGALSDDVANGIALDIDGKFVLAGSAGSSTTKSFALTRLNAAANLDANFGSSGKVTTTFDNNSLQECFDVAIQSDNKIVAVGYAGNDFALARYTGNAVAQLDNFQLTSPSNLATNQVYTNLNLNWTDAFGATYYEIVIDTNASYSTAQVLGSVASTLSINLLANKTYYWKVRSSEGGNFGSYTSTWSFSTMLASSSAIQDVYFNTQSVMPNPFKTELTIRVKLTAINQPYKIYDLTGRTVSTGVISDELCILKLQDVMSGTYILQIGENPKQVMKICKE